MLEEAIATKLGELGFLKAESEGMQRFWRESRNEEEKCVLNLEERERERVESFLEEREWEERVGKGKRREAIDERWKLKEAANG